jgi:hypothetical protein
MTDRLNDTAAIRNRGTHQYELKLRGDATVATAGKWTSPLESPWNPEHAFNGRGTGLGVSPQYGGGSVLAMKSERGSRSSPSPDKNRTVPGNGGSLSAAVACVNKGC